MSKTHPQRSDRKILADNRRARHHYIVLEKCEAGIALMGTEVKSVRDGLADLSAGFADYERGEIILRDVHIKPYEFGNQFNHEPCRPRRLLLHRREIARLNGQLTRRGLTLIPLTLYLNPRGLIKLELGLCQGKLARDKRDALRQKAIDHDMRRELAGQR